MPTTAWETIVRGTGARTLVLVPGTMGTATIFAPILDQLARDVRVIVASPPAETDVNALTDQLAALLDEHGATTIDLLGTSFGGWIVQYFAAKYPERVGTLILSNTFADPTLSPRRRPLDEMQAEPADEVKAKAIAMISGTPPSLTRDTLLEQLERLPAEVLKARQVAPILGSTAPPVDTSRVHVVLINTADDRVLAPASRDDLLARYPQCEQITLDHGGHFAYVTNVEAYLATLRDAIGTPA